MGKKKDETEKTNVMRVLDQKKIPYTPYAIETEFVNAEEMARALKKDPAMTFKTLVTEGNDRNHYVFVVPSNGNLDLKKAAKAVGVKSIAMIPQKDLLPLTGYIHGGCSPIGMKKQFKTIVDASCLAFEKIMFSAGKIGVQVELSPGDLLKLVRAEAVDIREEL